MRADADRGVKVFTSKKTLLPLDTCLLVISFIPEQTGKFSKEIRIVSSDSPNSYKVTLSGVIEKLRIDDKTACYYFGKSKNNNLKNEGPIVVNENQPKKAEPQTKNDSGGVVKPNVVKPKKKEDHPVVQNQQPPAKLNRPNNILFLVDISSSMRDSLKLPLMKTSLHFLIDEMRPVDSLSFVTYADTIKVRAEALSGNSKVKLHETVDALKAKGMTKGKKAILFSQKLAQKHFIEGGNNQIILATDGKFKFEEEDFVKWKSAQGDKAIIITTVAYGSDREAIHNLKEIAKKCGGSFILIKEGRGSRERLLEEVILRSR